MIPISKTPTSAASILVAYSKGQDRHNWGSLTTSDKDKLREALYNEQRGLCAYCMKPIRISSRQSSRIDHFLPRSVKPDLTFSYQNLLLSCASGHSSDSGSVNPSSIHCDQKKGDICLPPNCNPAAWTDCAMSVKFRYIDTTGCIVGCDDAAAALIEALNLNAPDLLLGRKSEMKAVKSRLLKAARKKGISRRLLLDGEKKRYKVGFGSESAYAGAVLYMLNDWLNK